MFQLRRRRRWATRRVLVVLLVVAALGAVAATFAGMRHRHSLGSAPTPIAAATSVSRGTVAPQRCPAVEDSAQGAAETAAAGLHALAVANLGPIDASPQHTAAVDTTLARYVTADRRPLVREYLATYPAPFTSTSSTPLGYRVVSYTPDRAVLRLATRDSVTTPAGTVQTSDSVTDATLQWDGLVGWWRLAVYKVSADPAAVATLAAEGTRFCP